MPPQIRDEYGRLFQPSIPFKPPKPPPYKGPKITNKNNAPLGELKLTGGFGYPTMGFLDFSKGSKNFGVRG